MVPPSAVIIAVTVW